MSYLQSSRGKTIAAICLTLAAFLMSGVVFAQKEMMGKEMMMDHTTSKFAGAKVNAGTATLSHKNMQATLTLSDDFVVPQTPDPHWRVVDSKGNIYDLQKLTIKGDKFNKSIVVPHYVPDIAKVQIWCAFAETLLGEASFEKPVMLMMMK